MAVCSRLGYTITFLFCHTITFLLCPNAVALHSLHTLLRPYSQYAPLKSHAFDIALHLRYLL